MKSILFVNQGGNGGGTLNMINIINHINRTKYNIDVLALHKSSLKICKENNINANLIDSSFYLKNRNYFIHSEVGAIKLYKINQLIKILIYWLKSALYFAPQILQRKQYNIVFLNSSVLTDWAFAAKKLGLKTIINIQEPISYGIFGVRRKIIQILINRYVDKIIAISKDNSERLGLHDKTTIIYNMIDEAKFYFDETEIRDEKYYKTVLYAGGVDVHKGFYTVVKSLKYLNKDVKILFAGSNKFSKKKLWQTSFFVNKYKIGLLNKIKNSGNVEFVGFSNDINKLLSRSSMTLSPFAVSHFSRLILETCAMKKCAIASNVKGMVEIIEHGVDGWLFEANNPKDLAEAINYLSLNPDIINEMSNKGFEKFKGKFSKNEATKVEFIFDEL